MQYFNSFLHEPADFGFTHLSALILCYCFIHCIENECPSANIVFIKYYNYVDERRSWKRLNCIEMLKKILKIIWFVQWVCAEMLLFSLRPTFWAVVVITVWDISTAHVQRWPALMWLKKNEVSFMEQNTLPFELPPLLLLWQLLIWPLFMLMHASVTTHILRDIIK